MAKRLFSRIKRGGVVAPPEPKPLDPKAEVFVLASGGESNLERVAARLRRMSGGERRELRESLQRLDSLLDDVSLELRSRAKGATK